MRIISSFGEVFPIPEFMCPDLPLDTKKSKLGIGNLLLFTKNFLSYTQFAPYPTITKIFSKKRLVVVVVLWILWITPKNRPKKTPFSY